MGIDDNVFVQSSGDNVPEADEKDRSRVVPDFKPLLDLWGGGRPILRSPNCLVFIVELSPYFKSSFDVYNRCIIRRKNP